MTSKNPSLTRPWARAGVHSIDHVCIAVPDFVPSEHFISNFGLRVQHDGDELHVRASDSEHVWVKVIEADRLKLQYISLGCYAEDLDQIRAQVEAAGGKFEPAHPHGHQDGFWFRDPDGNLVQVRAAVKTMVDEKAAMPAMDVPVGVRGAPVRSQAWQIHPRRMEHMLIYTPDVIRASAFYHDAVGIKVADSAQDVVAFTYARHGCDHHLLAFVKSNAPGLNHLSWDVPTVDELGMGQNQMRKAGYTKQWGVGRHVLGSNWFNYVRDPNGLWWEYSCHIDYIPKGYPYDGGDHDPENALYLWGPDVPEEMLQNSQA